MGIEKNKTKNKALTFAAIVTEVVSRLWLRLLDVGRTYNLFHSTPSELAAVVRNNLLDAKAFSLINRNKIQ